jgi:hypothetical protein
VASLSGNAPDALQEVLARAARDRDFRQQLLNDPRRGIQETFGLVIPAEFRIKFVERDPSLDALIVLPEYIGDDVLSDEELDSVAGGAPSPHQTWSRAVGERPKIKPPSSAF